LNGAIGRWLFGKSFTSLTKPVEAGFESGRGVKSVGLIEKAAKKPTSHQERSEIAELETDLKLWSPLSFVILKFVRQ
jgi:hypothetical protein